MPIINLLDHRTFALVAVLEILHPNTQKNMNALGALETNHQSALQVAVDLQRLPAMTQEAINKVRLIENICLQLEEQIEFPTEHLIHGGMYMRTLHMNAGEIMTGALLKVPTTLIVSGDCAVFIGTETIELRGYSVLPGSAGRKQIFLAHTDVSMTMMFPTSAATVAQAEKEFTDEYEMLMTNRMDCVTTLITGE